MSAQIVKTDQADVYLVKPTSNQLEFLRAQLEALGKSGRKADNATVLPITGAVWASMLETIQNLSDRVEALEGKSTTKKTDATTAKTGTSWAALPCFTGR